MITLPSFQLHCPQDLKEAVRLLAQYREEAQILAGGTDLIVNLRNRVFTPRHVVHLGAIRKLQAIEYSPQSGLSVGAMATISQLISDPVTRTAFPVLAQAARSVSGPTLKNMGTVGGNVCLDTRCQWYNQSYSWRKACGFCLKKEGDFCHVAPGSNLCWAAYSGDLAPAFLALGARVITQSTRGEREIPLHRFFLEDGKKRLDLAPDEIVTRLHVPTKKTNLQGYYGKLRVRGSVDYPLAGVAVTGRTVSGRFQDVTVALTAISPRPFLVEGAREILHGVPTDDEEAIERASQLGRRMANPMRTGGTFSSSYRRYRIGLFIRDGLREIASRT